MTLAYLTLYVLAIISLAQGVAIVAGLLVLAALAILVRHEVRALLGWLADRPKSSVTSAG